MFGMSVVSRQVQMIPPEAGRPVAAVNGDMFQSSYACPGDPDGLQIVRGELVSGPHPTRVCFWIDAQGNPHRTNVLSRFHVIWPNGARTPFGLNEEREYDGAVLFTSAVGPTTRTRGGREYLLVRKANSPWLPLKIGTTNLAVVMAVSETGNSPVTRNALVLSLGPSLAARTPRFTNGAVVQICTDTVPNLTGARTAIGGGPTLVSGGKPWQAPGFFHMRHPRSAIGWNKDYFFLVEVDGRQIGSVGMTMAELSNYLIKLGCDEAINLDGGGSAALWVDGRIVNNPSQGFERPSANCVVLMDRKKK
jgi:exopolysaccharide biosynthesis protein